MKNALSLAEVEEIINADDFYRSDEEDNLDIILIPPTVDEITDEEEVDDDTTLIDAPEIHDAAGTFEIKCHLEEEQSEASYLESQPSTSRQLSAVQRRKKSKQSVSKKQKLSREEAKWTSEKPNYKQLPEGNSKHVKNTMNNIKEKYKNCSPVQIFELFWNEKIYVHIVKETVRYASFKNEQNFVF